MGASRHRSLGSVLALSAVLLGAASGAAPGFAQEPAPQPERRLLEIVGVEVTPPSPGPETLCQLRVRIANRAERPIYALGFDVRLDDQPLPVYAHQLYYQKLAPGETTEVRLFNFWTTETGRARPADGELTVDVILREASWLEVKTEPEDGSEAPVEVWRPAGAVDGLPVSGSVVLEI